MNNTGLIVRKGHLYPDRKNLVQTRKFIATLRELAEKSEQNAKAAKPYRASLLTHHARKARADADRLESLI